MEAAAAAAAATGVVGASRKRTRTTDGVQGDANGGGVAKSRSPATMMVTLPTPRVTAEAIRAGLVGSLPPSIPATLSTSSTKVTAPATSRAFLDALLPTVSEANLNSKLLNKYVVLSGPPSWVVRMNNQSDAERRTERRQLRQQLQHRTRATRREKTMSRADRKQRGLFHIPRHGVTYADMLPLHTLWSQYMRDVFTDETTRHQPVLERVLKSDLHGAILGVVRARCPSFVGASGIVLQETQETFRIVTQENVVKVLPKAHSVFHLTICDRTFELYGDQICYRASERSVKKFKTKSNVQL